MSDSVTQQAQPNSFGCRYSRPHIPTALVAEDHPDFRDLLSLILERLGYEVVGAADGEQALHLALHTQPNLIVTDLSMPQIDALEFLRRLRPTLDDRKPCKIVMLTAYDPADYREAAAEAGCDIILSKPLDLERFANIVGAH